MLPAYQTPRLVARAWTPDDAPAFKAAVDASRDHLRPWLPWADDHPQPVEASAALLGAFGRDFAAGGWWGFGLFPRDAAEPGRGSVLGGVGVHRPRHPDQPPSTREIGYWLAAGATGRGYMTEAVGALTEAALAEPGVLRVEIRVDPANAGSARVPVRLGFALRARLVGNRVPADGVPRDTLVWERRGGAGLRLATPADLPRLVAIREAVRAASPVDRAPAIEADYLAVIRQGTCWVWEDAGGVHGFAASAPAADALTWALFIHPDAEHRGAGGTLLARLTDELWARGHRRLTFDTRSGTPAEQVYRAAGWRETGRSAAGSVSFARDL